MDHATGKGLIGAVPVVAAGLGFAWRVCLFFASLTILPILVKA